MSEPKGTAVGEQDSVAARLVRYRLRQITELFGDQLGDPDRRFELQLALRVRQLEGSRVAGRGNPPRSAPKDTEAKTDGQP